jgi:uncharacterized membrane protein YphA (DoxX/SURF4 family)
MNRWLGRYSELIYAVMRLVVGLLFASHGAQKLFGAFGGRSQLSNPMMLAARASSLLCTASSFSSSPPRVRAAGVSTRP